jgi:cytochrome P450
LRFHWTLTCASKNQKNYTKSYIQTKDLAKYVGKGLLTVEGEHWQKKINSASFHKGQLKLLVDTIQKTILAELKILKLENRWMFSCF